MPDAPDPDFLARLTEAISRLPRRQRDIFVAHRVHGLACDEIARRAGLSPAEVERQLVKALRSINRHMSGRRRWRAGWTRPGLSPRTA